MLVRCVCDKWHDVSATGLAIIIRAFQDGDLIRMSAFRNHQLNGHITLCVSEAFTPERVREFAQRYKGNIIKFDGKVYP